MKRSKRSKPRKRRNRKLKAQCHNAQRGAKRAKRNCTGWGSCVIPNPGHGSITQRARFPSTCSACHEESTHPADVPAKGILLRGALAGPPHGQAQAGRGVQLASAYALAPPTPARLGGNRLSHRDQFCRESLLGRKSTRQVRAAQGVPRAHARGTHCALFKDQRSRRCSLEDAAHVGRDGTRGPNGRGQGFN
jgi:hypothetical protein